MLQPTNKDWQPASSTLKLIELVKNNPAIYDNTITDFWERENRDLIWQKIAEELQLDANDCRTKWVNIRTAFSTYLRRAENPVQLKTKGASKEYYLAKHLGFLTKFTLKKVYKKSRQPKLNGKQTISGSNIAPDEGSCSTLLTSEADIDEGISDEEHKFEILETPALPKTVKNELEEPAVRSFPIRKCRVEISTTDQNFPLLQQREAEHHSKLNKDITETKRKCNQESTNEYLHKIDFQTIYDRQIEKAYEKKVTTHLEQASHKNLNTTDSTISVIKQEKDENSHLVSSVHISKNPVSRQKETSHMDSNLIVTNRPTTRQHETAHLTSRSLNEHDETSRVNSSLISTKKIVTRQDETLRSQLNSSLAISSKPVAKQLENSLSGSSLIETKMSLTKHDDISRLDSSLVPTKKPSIYQDETPHLRSSLSGPVIKQVETLRLNSSLIPSPKQVTRQDEISHSKATKRPFVNQDETLIPTKTSKASHESTTMTFFKGVLPDITKLSERRLRLFKQDIMLILNRSLDEQENELKQKYS